MVVDRKVTGTAASMPGGLLAGWITGVAITMIGAGISAALIVNEKVAEEGIGYCAMAIILLAAYLSELVSAARIKRRRAQVCLISGGIYYLTLLAGTALFFGGQYQGMGVTGLLVIAASGVAILQGLHGGKQRVNRKHKIRNR